MPLIKQINFQFILLFSIGFISFSAIAATEEDPWEKFNRSMYKFNDSLDKAILKPVAKGYDRVVPNIIKKGTSNFFSNIGEVNSTANNLLQGKLGGTAASGSRLLINSTIGLLGILDVATIIGIDKQEEDFGQTLGHWGTGSGPYLVIPFFGPSTLRDGTGAVVDFAVDSYVYDEFHLHWEDELTLDVLDVVQSRAKLLAIEGLIIGDPYSFIRDVYLQSRENEIHDGNPPASVSDDEDDAWGDDGWDDDFEEDDGWGDGDIDYGDEENLETSM